MFMAAKLQDLRRKTCNFVGKMKKIKVYSHFFPKKFGSFKKSSYFCTRLTAIPASVAQLVRAPDC